MKTLTRAVIGACIAIGALVGAANIASADPTITSVVPESQDVTNAINSDLVDRIESTDVGGPLPSRFHHDCDVYVVAGAGSREARVCVEY